MSWKVSNSIQHIEHIWQPQENWAEAAKHYYGIFEDLHCHLEDRVNINTMYFAKYIWTTKIDDAVSLMVSKAGGGFSVAYKGHPCMQSNDEEIEDYYSGKPHMIYPLKNLLKYAPIIFENAPDNTDYQIAYLGPRTEGILPMVITPNVTTYERFSKPRAKIALSIVAAISVHTGKVSQDILFDKVDHEEVFMMPSYVHFHYDGALNLQVAIRKMHLSLNVMYDNNYFPVVENHVPQMQMFLNKQVRTRLRDQSYREFLEERCVYMMSTRKTEKAKLNFRAAFDRLLGDIEANPDAFTAAFNLVDQLRKINRLVHTYMDFVIPGVSQTPRAEGLVVSLGLQRPGELSYKDTLMFKFVDEEFSYDNFKKWAEYA